MTHDPLQQREAQARDDFIHTYLAMSPRRRQRALRQLLIDVVDIESQGEFEDLILEMIGHIDGRWESRLRAREEYMRCLGERVMAEHAETLKKLAV